MLTDEQLDELTKRLLKKITPMLGLEYKEPQPVTAIEDENGLVHDLAKLVNMQCIIDTGTSIFMAVQDFTNLDTDPLAKRIRIDEFVENPNLNVTIHEFRDMRTQRTVFYL